MTFEEHVADLIETYTYWGEHPDFFVENWQCQVANGECRRGYWEWVVEQLQWEEQAQESGRG